MLNSGLYLRMRHRHVLSHKKIHQYHCRWNIYLCHNKFHIFELFEQDVQRRLRHHRMNSMEGELTLASNTF